MKKQKVKFISMALALSLMGSMIQTSFAELDITWDESGWGYQPIDENTAKLMKYDDNIIVGNVLEIPTEIDGYKIIDFHQLIFSEADFEMCDLSEFSNLGYFMFMNSDLENVTLSKELTTLPAAAFYGTKIKNIELPEGLTTIEVDALASCENLEEIVVPSTVTEIQQNAFGNCSKLWKVTVKNGLVNLGDSKREKYTIFPGHNLKVAIIPESVQYIGPNEFREAVEIEGQWVYGDYPEDFVIYAEKGSYAEKFAKENGINYQSLISVCVNNNELEFDQPPIIENNRTLVPFRAIFEELGADVEWNETLRSVKATKDDTTIILTVGKETMLKNGESVVLEAAPTIVNNRTLVPVRAIAESFGNEVSWNEAEMRVDVE